MNRTGNVKLAEDRGSSDPEFCGAVGRDADVGSEGSAPLDLDRFYTLTEVARLFRRSARTIRDWVSDGVLVPVRIKGRRGLYFRRADIERLAGGASDE